MRKVATFTHATLDGYIDVPHEWSFPYADEDLQAHLLAHAPDLPLAALFQHKAQLLGVLQIGRAHV